MAIKSWGDYGKELVENGEMLEPGCSGAAYSPPWCLLWFAGCKKVKESYFIPLMGSSVSSQFPLSTGSALPAAAACAFSEEHRVVMVPPTASMAFSDHPPPSQPLLRAKASWIISSRSSADAISLLFLGRWWCSSPTTSCPRR